MNNYRITVLGGGTSGVLTVYYILKNFPSIKVDWIFPENNLPIGVGEATIPQVCDFLSDLGINYEVIINDIGGSFKMGIKFDGFSKFGDFIHPFGIDKKSYLKHEKYIKDNLIDKDIFSNSLNYAVHFDVRKMIDYLYNKIKLYNNVNIIRKEASDIVFSNDGILNVDGIKSDLYIDSSGFKKVLIGKLLNDNFKEFKLKNNGAYVYRDIYKNRKEQFKNHTTVKAMNYGWVWKIPLLEKLSIGYIHNNLDKENVNKEFINYITNEFGSFDIDKLNYVPFITGRNEKHFYKNVFAIGLSSAFIEPMESTGLYFITENIRKLGKFLKKEMSIDQINQEINYDYDGVMHFILAHYKFSNNTNSYWDYYKNIDLELFKGSGLFGDYNWYFVINGLIGKKILEYKKDFIFMSREYRILSIYKKIYNCGSGIDYNDFINNKKYEKRNIS